jgi:membrane protease YdiL (CAAX protease family)
MIGDSIQLILLFGALGAITNWFAWNKGFYTLSQGEFIPLGWLQVIGVFAIYLFIIRIVAPYLGMLLLFLSGPHTPPVAMMNIVQLLVLITLIIALFFFCLPQSGMMKKIWKQWSRPLSNSILYDIGLGALTWFIAFPIVAVIGQFFDIIIYLFFNVESYEQVAVRYLKTTLVSPSQLFIALLTILLIAPSIEEFLFRGCLQTFFKRHFGTKSAILLSALCFSIFHFSLSQGVGNIPLIASLFTFACFLGFIYERQSSLFASISLHVTFNLASSLRILFYPEG